MEANIYEVLHRIATALERQNQLLENKEKREIYEAKKSRKSSEK